MRLASLARRAATAKVRSHESQALRRLPVPPHEDAALLARLSARFAETAADHDRDGTFPRDNFAALQAQGLIALVAPRAHGGGGASLEAARRVLAAVAYGEPATALILTMTWLQHHAIGRGDSRWPPSCANACCATPCATAP